MIFMSPSASANVALPEPPPKDVLHQALSGSQEAADRFVAAWLDRCRWQQPLLGQPSPQKTGHHRGFQIVSVLGDKNTPT